MKTEKKLIAYCAIAIMVGAATMVPLLFLMTGTANAQTPTDEPWFNLNIPYAYVNGNFNGHNDTTTFAGEIHSIIANVSSDSSRILEDADARIEYYQLHVYSDQGFVYDLTYYVGIAKPGELVNRYNSTLFFLGGSSYSTNSTSGGVFLMNPQVANMSLGVISGSTLSYNSTILPPEVVNIQNANTLYIDVSRLSYVTFKGNVTTMTTQPSGVLQHIELTKTDSGFVYGSMEDISVPFPIEGPTTTQTTSPQILPSNTTTASPIVAQVFNFVNQP